jgi:hypothetical protein
MKSSAVLGMVFLLFSGLAAKAQSNVCFSTVADWQKVRSELPSTMQTVPIYAIHQSWDMTGAAEIVVVGNTFQISGRIQDVFVGDITDSGTVAQACIQGTQMTVAFTTGQSQTIDLTPNGISVDGYEFDTTTQQTFQSVMSGMTNTLVEY